MLTMLALGRRDMVLSSLHIATADVLSIRAPFTPDR